MADEPMDTGVGEQEIAPPAPEGAEGVSESSPIAPEPKKPVNLSDLPEFRQYQSRVDKEKADWQRREAALLQQANAERAAAKALQERLLQAEIEGQPNDYGKLTVQLRHAQEQLQRTEQERIRLEEQQATEQVRRQYIRDHVAKFKGQHGYDMPETLFANAGSPSDVEAITINFLREAQAKEAKKRAVDERTRNRTDDVDMGVGTPTSPQSDYEEKIRQAAMKNDLGGSLQTILERARAR